MRSALVSAAAIALLAACGDDPAGAGTVNVTAYGEPFIEEGIPASALEDGWAVSFDRFDVSVRDVTVAGTSIEVLDVVDLSRASGGEGFALGSAEVSAGDHTGASFTVVRIEVEGQATKGAETKRFAWVFDAPTRYAECETTTSIPDGGAATFEITIHADHLLYDSLVAEEPALRFQALADADLDADGAITRAELEATDIGAYDPGSGGGIDDLWAFLSAQATTLGHVDGEGHCRATVVE